MATSQPPDWAAGLLPEQVPAASSVGSHSRLLAGPGTGKTWTLRARVEFLILEKKVEASAVTALTFTRAAASELRSRVDKALEGKVADRPNIMTLHAFALRTLIHNVGKLEALPEPLRIADDWEERNIIVEDLKAITGKTVKQVLESLQALSADWDTLRADANTPNPLRADPTFLGAWQEHRMIFGYTLRAELVYQLKRALEQRSDIKLVDDVEHLIVDEYQDLNACDLAVVMAIKSRGAELYGAGDDDQSIYGFRHANPEGIRRFEQDNSPSSSLALATCMRCDKSIMELARFVADLDARRLQKPWIARGDAGEGEVKLLRFPSGEDEALGIASVARHLIDEENVPPGEILILIRSDMNGAFSRPLAAAMATAGVPFYINVTGESILDTLEGRTVLSVLRLVSNRADSLAIRALLQLRDNGVGAKTLSRVYDFARSAGLSFGEALARHCEGEAPSRLKDDYLAITKLVDAAASALGKQDEALAQADIEERFRSVCDLFPEITTEVRNAILAHIMDSVCDAESSTVSGVLGAIAARGVSLEQEMEPGAVNLLTMHKAKGLSAGVVMIIACEDEYVPGRQQSVDKEADERRLLYVSLTRARNKLFISYAQGRDGAQRYTGRDSGKRRRNLTRYLRGAEVKPVDGLEFVAALGQG